MGCSGIRQGLPAIRSCKCGVTPELAKLNTQSYHRTRDHPKHWPILKHNCALQVYDCIEVFSGQEVLSDSVRDLGLAVASMDIVNWKSYSEKRAKAGRPLKCGNGLDLCGPAGFALLCIISIS